MVAQAGQPGGGKRHRAKYGTALTFAGRRPPQDPEKRKAFDLLWTEYYRQKEQDRMHGRSGRIYTEHKTSGS